MQTTHDPAPDQAGDQTSPPEPAEDVEDALLATMMMLGRRMRQRYPGDEIDFSSFPILKTLSHQGPMRLSQLAHLLELDASTVSRHARQLEDRGLLERTGDPDDGRASRVTVSDAGSACLAKGFETRRSQVTAALANWTAAERDTLRDLLNRLVEDLAVPPNRDAPAPTASRLAAAAQGTSEANGSSEASSS